MSKHVYLDNICVAVGLLFICSLMGCSWRPVNMQPLKNIFYEPQPGSLEIGDAPGVPIAIIERFSDERCGEATDPDYYKSITAIPLVPYCTFEFPQFYRVKPKEGLCPDDPDCPTWPTLREQCRRVV